MYYKCPFYNYYTELYRLSGSFAIQTINGNYLTAINGGGMGEAANRLPIHTDATNISTWEKFRLVDLQNGYYGIQTINGRYLTAINGGGVGEPANRLPMHTDATSINSWEKFRIIDLGDGYVAIQTNNGRYLTAVNGGGMGDSSNQSALVTDRTQVAGTWEWFKFIPLEPVQRPPQPPWTDPAIRQLIDEWLRQQDRCVKRIYPKCYIDRWGRLCGDTGTTLITCTLDPDHPVDWDNYHYLWAHNWCPMYYSYTVQDYVSRRQRGESFNSLARCKGKNDPCI